MPLWFDDRMIRVVGVSLVAHSNTALRQAHLREGVMSGRRVDSFSEEIEELKRKIALLGTNAQSLRIYHFRYVSF